jgi:hypothetical protein
VSQVLQDSTTVDQSRAAPSGDAVGRDKIVNHNSTRKSQIEGWLDKLAAERRDDVQVREFVDSIQYYLQPSPSDGISGLEAKLDHAGRSAQKKAALRKKEAFSKLLEAWRSYPAAQEIFAYFLTKIEATFEAHILPKLSSVPPAEIDQLISSQLVDPIIEEMGTGPFMLNYLHVHGMVYWLAEQCYIRWHA